MNANIFVFFVLFNCLTQFSCARGDIDILNNLFDSNEVNEEKKSKKELDEHTTVDSTSWYYFTPPERFTEPTPSESTTSEYIYPSTPVVCRCESGAQYKCGGLSPCPDEPTDERWYDTMFLITASQVILGVAIVMGLSALVTLLVRACSNRRRYASNIQASESFPDEFGRTGIRASISSLQQRVMSKLRDRPPRYETRHNYDYQRQQRSTRIVVLNPGAETASNNLNIPPPAYENNEENSSNEPPPAYTIVIGDQPEQSTASEPRTTESQSDINNRVDNALHI